MSIETTRQDLSFCTDDTQSVTQKQDNAEVILCGIFTVLKELTIKRENRMAFLELKDTQGTIEVVAFADVYTEARESIMDGKPLMLSAKVQHDDKGTKLIANKIHKLDES